MEHKYDLVSLPLFGSPQRTYVISRYTRRIAAYCQEKIQERDWSASAAPHPTPPPGDDLVPDRPRRRGGARLLRGRHPAPVADLALKTIAGPLACWRRAAL